MAVPSSAGWVANMTHNDTPISENEDGGNRGPAIGICSFYHNFVITYYIYIDYC